ncbi:MAG TPA: helix-turn-helix transcriptional regulator [Candidatus Acidoferrales bacterium]
MTPRQPADFLGEFEQMVLLATLLLGDAAYAVPIRREIERRARRVVSRGAVYITLDRLEEKGYLGSHLGEATPERGGRARRYYRVKPAGVAALKRSYAALERMWEGAQTQLGEV